MLKKFINMATGRVRKFVRRIFNMKATEKKNERKNTLKRDITVIYNIGSKTHTAEFKAYALLGMWFVNNWRRINKIVDIQVK